MKLHPCRSQIRLWKKKGYSASVRMGVIYRSSSEIRWGKCKGRGNLRFGTDSLGQPTADFVALPILHNFISLLDAELMVLYSLTASTVWITCLPSLLIIMNLIKQSIFDLMTLCLSIFFAIPSGCRISKHTTLPTIFTLPIFHFSFTVLPQVDILLRLPIHRRPSPLLDSR